jgi:hypothetical protein
MAPEIPDTEIEIDEVYSTEVEDMMLEIAWKDYDYCFNDKTVVENKISILLASNALLVGLISTISNNLNPRFLPFGYLFLFGSILLGIIALNFRDYYIVRALPLWEQMKEEGCEDIPYRAKRSMFKTIDSATEKNRKKYCLIVKYTQYSIYLFTLGLIIVIISILLPKLFVY